MAITFQEKVDLIGKYKDKNDKFASVYKYGKNIDSPKLNDEQKEKVRKNVEVAYNAIKQMQEKKPTKTATAKGGAKKKTMLGLASEIKKRDNVSWDEAKKRAKRDYESERKKLEKEEKQQLADFKKQVGKIKFVRATTKTDIKKDKVIPALPSGKRYPKRGKTTNKWGTFNNNPKKPYWENRANRMDVNQPSKSVYPKLAKGGKFNDNLYFDQLASMSGTRAVAVKEWASANNLSDNDLLNIIQGLGRKQITASQFVNAVLGNKTATSEVVSYAKEGKGFKMAKGGKTKKFGYSIHLVVKKDYGNEGGIIANFVGKGDAMISARALNENSPENYEYSVKESSKMAKGGLTEHGLEVGDEIVMDVKKTTMGKMPTTIGVKDYDKEFHLVDLDKGERYAKGGATKRIKRMGC